MDGKITKQHGVKTFPSAAVEVDGKKFVITKATELEAKLNEIVDRSFHVDRLLRWLRYNRLRKTAILGATLLPVQWIGLLHARLRVLNRR